LQLKGIYSIMDKRQKAVANKDLPLESYVKQLERMLDEGYYVEYKTSDDEMDDFQLDEIVN